MQTKYKFLCFLAALTFAGCDDILEEDISDDTIQLVFPLAGVEVSNNVVNFQWNSLSGADSYRIQVHSLNQGIVLDSVVEQSHFLYPLSPGEYQWRVKGRNFAYETPYTFSVNFSVIETDNLTNQVVLLSNPQSGIYTNNVNLSFSWMALPTAENYHFSLNNTVNNAVIYEQSGITGNGISLNGQTADDGQYSWKVKAVNQTSETDFFSRNFYLDTVPPNVPQNSAPADNATQDNNTDVNFSWNISPDSGAVQSAIHFVIEFSTNINFTDSFLTSETSVTNFSYTFNSPGDYYWRVKAVDKAENQSNYSNPYKLTIE